MISQSHLFLFQYDFISVACESAEMTALDQQQIIHAITENGWREDTCIRHVTSRSLPPGMLNDDLGKGSFHKFANSQSRFAKDKSTQSGGGKH